MLTALHTHHPVTKWCLSTSMNTTCTVFVPSNAPDSLKGSPFSVNCICLSVKQIPSIVFSFNWSQVSFTITYCNASHDLHTHSLSLLNFDFSCSNCLKISKEFQWHIGFTKEKRKIVIFTLYQLSTINKVKDYNHQNRMKILIQYDHHLPGGTCKSCWIMKLGPSH